MNYCYLICPSNWDGILLEDEGLKAKVFISKEKAEEFLKKYVEDNNINNSYGYMNIYEIELYK